MEDPKPEKPKKLKDHDERRRVAWMVVLAVLIVAATMAVHRESTSADELATKEIAKAKAEGLWVDTVNDLLPKVDPKDNAEPVYAAIKPEDIRRTGKVVDGTWRREPGFEWIARDKVLEAINQAELVNDRPYFVPNQKDVTDENERFRGAGVLWDVAMAFAIRANFEARGDQPEKAFKDLERVAHCVRQAASAVRAIGPGLWNNCLRQLYGSVQFVLTRQPGLAGRLQAILAAAGPPPPLEDMWRGELFHLNERLKVPLPIYARTIQQFFAQAPDAAKSSLSWVRKQWLYGVVRYYRSLNEAYKDSRSFAQFARAAAELDQALFKSKRPENRGLILLNQNFPPSVNAVRQYGVSLTRMRILAQAAALFQRQAPFPKHLPLKGEAAIDPLSDHPLRYETSGYTFVITGTQPGWVSNQGMRAPETAGVVTFAFPRTTLAGAGPNF